jgi:hypothetical protein
MISILKHVVVIDEDSFKLGILLGHPPISSFDMLLATRRGFKNMMFPVVVHPLRWFLCLLGVKSFHFIPYIPPFLGCYGLFMIGRFSSMPTTTHL